MVLCKNLIVFKGSSKFSQYGKLVDAQYKKVQAIECCMALPCCSLLKVGASMIQGHTCVNGHGVMHVIELHGSNGRLIHSFYFNSEKIFIFCMTVVKDIRGVELVDICLLTCSDG